MTITTSLCTAWRPLYPTMRTSTERLMDSDSHIRAHVKTHATEIGLFAVRTGSKCCKHYVCSGGKASSCHDDKEPLVDPVQPNSTLNCVMQPYVRLPWLMSAWPVHCCTDYATSGAPLGSQANEFTYTAETLHLCYTISES